MEKEIDIEGYELERIGQCTTNPRPGSVHTQTVQPHHLWSFAQEEALVAMSEQGPDKCWRLIQDPERRAKRIAARYADLYFQSVEKSRGQLQLYWPGLAAFVVKDIVEAYRYSREQVLCGGWRNAMRTSSLSTAASYVVSDGSPYEHALRVYAALAKGNLWLFMDIYPWLWFVLEYGVGGEGQLMDARLKSHVGARSTDTLQDQSKTAVQELPFGERWLGRLKDRIAADPVYTQASKFFAAQPFWSGADGGYGQHEAQAIQAHRHVQQHARDYDAGYRVPPSPYWSKFKEAYYVMDEERRELGRIADDSAALSRLRNVSRFASTPEMVNTYNLLIEEFKTQGEKPKFGYQQKELVEIAKQEQLNVLQPLIYDDAKLMRTMDINHKISRYSGGFLSPRYAVTYSAQPTTSDPNLQTVFDEPKNPWDYVTGPKASLPNPVDRMAYVNDIADDYNRLMTDNRAYMESELRKIRAWLNA